MEVQDVTVDVILNGCIRKATVWTLNHHRLSLSVENGEHFVAFFWE